MLYIIDFQKFVKYVKCMLINYFMTLFDYFYLKNQNIGLIFFKFKNTFFILIYI